MITLHNRPFEIWIFKWIDVTFNYNLVNRKEIFNNSQVLAVYFFLDIE